MKRSCRTPDYNWNFDLETGYFQRWGRTLEDDPLFSPLGPEILDIEISTSCSGTSCSYCYKSNTPQGKHMSVEEYCRIIDKIPFNLTQVALGIGDTDRVTNLEQILRETRYRGIVPNITINDYNCDDACKTLANNCGSIAVSCYEYERCLYTIQRLRDYGAQQVNIHQVIARDNYQECLNLISRLKDDPRREGINALVFLMLKPKGRAQGLLPPTTEQFNTIVRTAIDSGINIGFDSCSAPMVLKYFYGTNDFERVSNFIEPCESFLFSAYCNVDGEFFPCSFCEGEEEWKEGLEVKDDFLQNVWYHPRTIAWRQKLLTTNNDCVSCPVKDKCRRCPIF